MDLKQGIEMLTKNITFKSILTVLRSIGNFLNGSEVSSTLAMSAVFRSPAAAAPLSLRCRSLDALLPATVHSTLPYRSFDAPIPFIRRSNTTPSTLPYRSFDDLVAFFRRSPSVH